MTLPGSSKHKFNNMSILMHWMQKIQNESNLDASLQIKFQIASMYPSKIHHLSHVITNNKYKIFPKALLIISY